MRIPIVKNVYHASIARIVLIFIVALLIPVLSYSIYQYAQSNQNEDLLKSIYARQLQTLLFSVNQTIYDRFNTSIVDLSAALQRVHSQDWNNALLKDISVEEGVMATVVRTGEEKVIYYGYRDDAGRYKGQCVAKMEQIIKERHPDITRVMKRARNENYIHHLTEPLKAGLDKKISLVVFPVITQDSSFLAGFVIDQLTFIKEVVGREFSIINDIEYRESEMGDGNFIFAIKDRMSNQTIYSTDNSEAELFEISEKLWVLDDLDIMVKMSGTNLNEIARSRTRKNLMVLGLVNIGLIIGVLYIMRNISLEMGLAEMKTDFVANVSHELRTPLALIRMYTETLEMGRVKADKKKYYYKTIISESTRLTQLINNILDFSKIQTRMKRYHFHKTDLREILENAVNSYKFHFDRHKFDIHLEMEKQIPIIQADRDAVTQAVVNLFDNAIKYSGDSKKIDIFLIKKNNSVILSVTDFGIGIAESEQDKIFEKFYRIGSSLEHNTKGSGLGLSLIQHIMQVHHGEIIVKSKPGRGSTFSLIFPAKLN